MHCDHAFYVGGTHENAADLGELERLPGCCGDQGVHGRVDRHAAGRRTTRASRRSCAHIRRRAAFHSEDEYRLAERRPLRAPRRPPSHPEVRDAESALQSHPAPGAHRAEARASASTCCTSRRAEEIDVPGRAQGRGERRGDAAAPDAGRAGVLRAARHATPQMNPPIRDARHRDGDLGAECERASSTCSAPTTRRTRCEEKAQPYPGIAVRHAGRADAGADHARPRERGAAQRWSASST